MSLTWILDLDNTLYPAASGLFRLIDANIQAFMRGLGIPASEVPALRDRYRARYGLTLCGLMAHHGVDPDEYQTFVHDVPLGAFLAPDPELDAALGRLDGRRVVFTNGSGAHARAVLGHLGVAHRVERVFDLSFMDYTPKPQPHGYHKMLDALGSAAERCWMVDDLPENLDTASALGMATVLVGAVPRPPHLLVASVVDLPGLLLAPSRTAG
ncbi:MAG: pyrimidine 5'-nucleotidase [Deltaproteobacteria bacterium]|nr:pyrimidine 5'-nucleotidase [Deltaproteobacteria bacterium]